MTDFDDDLDSDLDEMDANDPQSKKKKTGKTETESQGRTAVSVSEGFYGYMAAIGASPSTIANILKSWSHLRGQGLLRAITDFIKGASTRATAHVEVDIGRDKGFTLLQDLVSLFRKTSRAPTNTQRLDNKNRFDPK